MHPAAANWSYAKRTPLNFMWRVTRRRVATFALVTGLSLFTASCASSVTPTGKPGLFDRSSPTGTVKGVFEMVGGPPGAGPDLVPGTVTLSGPGGTVNVEVGSSGHFAIRLPVGRYRIEGHSPIYESGQGPCNGGDVHIRIGHMTRVDVRCQMR